MLTLSTPQRTVEHFVLYIVLRYKHRTYYGTVEMKTNTGRDNHDNGESSYPGKPPLSMWLAKVTSSLHTSNCHFRRPSTPHSTFPVWIPILMSTLKPVASRTNLRATRFNSRMLFAPHFYAGTLVASTFSLHITH